MAETVLQRNHSHVQGDYTGDAKKILYVWREMSEDGEPPVS